jgi:glycosyltransferase involved in cell wall biosynthesis
MKILHILTDSGVGGAGILLENMLTHSSLPRSCFTVVLPRGAAMAPRLSARGFRVFPILRGADRSFALRDLFRLIMLIRREKPHILHTHASLTGRIAGWLAGVPIRLATRHCAYKVKPGRHQFSSWVHRMADKSLTTCTVATAGAAAKNLMALGIPPEKILLIRNGARAVSRLPAAQRDGLRRQLSIDEEAFVVGICARLAPVKDHMTLLRAAKLLEEQHGYHFLIVGGGEQEAALRAAAKEMGIAGSVTFTGHQEDPAPYLTYLTWR